MNRFDRANNGKAQMSETMTTTTIIGIEGGLESEGEKKLALT